MKLASIFFTASKSIFEVHLKDTNKRVRYAKFTLAYFKTSESIFDFYQRYEELARKRQEIGK